MNVELCTDVAGGSAGQTVEVEDQYGEWLVSQGYAVHGQAQGRHRASERERSSSTTTTRAERGEDEDDDEDSAPNAHDDDHIRESEPVTRTRKRGAKASS